MKSLTAIVVSIKRAFAGVSGLGIQFDAVKINQGSILAELHARKQSTNLRDYEFKVFSQWGEDGILQHLVNAVEIKEKTFIEFGVEDFYESSCRFLLMKDNWRGFVIDGSASNIERLKSSYFYWKHELTAICAFITRESINDLLAQSGFSEDLGILAVDLDGNDFYILDAVRFFRPRILICEFNAVFGTRKITVPYDAAFARTAKHYSNLYWGASLSAMAELARQKGYSLVGTNSACNNAFFVRNDLVNGKVEVLSSERAFEPSKFRESRDENGNLTYLSGNERLAAIKGLPVFNVEMQELESL